MRVLTLLALLLLWPIAQGSSPFDASFTAETMRVDYFHTGGPKSGETLALDGVRHDGPWAGSRTVLIDESNLGPYMFDVRDKTDRVLYSRGFASIYGEWETTAEAKAAHRTFHESLRFPWPRQPVTVSVHKRDAQNRFTRIWTTEIDPGSRFVNRAAPSGHAGKVVTLIENGPAAQKVDLLVISEGYTADQMAKFQSDAKRLLDSLFAEEPFRSRRGDFNVRALLLPSAEPGVHRPNAGVHRRTPLGTQYNVFDSERYMLTLDNRALRDAASAAPYEFIEILANERTYGGGGIFNDHATASVDSAFSEYVFVHEFAHHFAALADEYYTSDVAYATGTGDRPEPWEPNVTADPTAAKWKDLLTPGVPLPTPWPREAFTKRARELQDRRKRIREQNRPEAEMDALFALQQKEETALLGRSPHAGKVGAFEGANYEAAGYYRPQVDCIMFSRDPVPFCAVCRRALDRVIDQYAGEPAATR
jgi:hypothetical protein